MSLFLDEQYLKRVSYKLEFFRQKSAHTYACKCYKCGDSKKKASKTRGGFFQRAGTLLYHCFNCSYSVRFSTALAELDAGLFDEYRMESFKERMLCEQNSSPKLEDKPVVETKKYVPDIFDGLPLVYDDTTSLAYAWATKRKIPNSLPIFYVEKFYQWSKGNTDKFIKASEKEDHPRIIIPWYAEDKTIIGYSARAIRDEDVSVVVPKYYRIFITDNKERVFGLDRIKKGNTVYVTEGEIDSMMLPNGVAVANAKLHSYLNRDSIYIPDSDTRNPQIMKIVSDMIDIGLKVCMMPDTLGFKDLNEAVVMGKSQQDLIDMIHTNTYNGLAAKLYFEKWRKTDVYQISSRRKSIGEQ